MSIDPAATPPEPSPPAGLVSGGPYRYARWDGRQRLLDVGADDVLDALADDLLAEGDLADALARLFRRGLRPSPGTAADGLAGLAELRRRLNQARQELLSRYELADVLGDVRRELEEIVAVEQRGIERRLSGANGIAGDPDASLRGLAADLAAKRQAELEGLPADPGGRIRGLQDYDFLEPDARQRFQELVERLQRQVLDSYFAGLSDAIRGMTPDQLTQNREMVRDLNRLLQERLSGEEPDVSEFLARHGGFFPGARTLDDIIEQLAQRMAAMQSLMSSLSADQRQELQDLLDSLLRDDRLRWDLAQLAGTLDQLLPDGLGQRFDFQGPESLSLEGALQQLGRLSDMEHLADRLREVHSPAALDAIDPDELARLLDPAAADELRALQDLSRRLEEAGYAERRGERLQLTPRGSRRLGQRVLDELFSRLNRDVFGGHVRHASGPAGERAETSRPYEFGRPFELDLKRTLGNALSRPENAGRRRPDERRRVRLAPSDFEVHEMEDVSRAATVLLVDMSRSMLLRGCFLAAKKVAMALDMLIRTRYPRDELNVVGFAYYAREIRPGGLATLSWHGYEYGTNLQHGLIVARQLLARSHAANREIVVITDGEPTAHFENGQVEFSYPPTRRTLLETLREVGRCTRDGITINTFMLERSRALGEFVERMTRLNRGRAFYATPERLGEYVLVDYVDRRRA
ncbi:MAG TPA: hypothetical protein VK992_03895 [Candidatus Caenarcaniphilales bacterium]|nr:hypothetical protein [Candidatus Caenarcaniphilales bacterium]